jgi:hypothetical protein
MPKKKQQLIAKKIERQIARPFAKVVKVLMWITGVIVALAVGFGMAYGPLTVPYLEMVVPIAGWIVIVLTIAGVIMAIIDALS